MVSARHHTPEPLPTRASRPVAAPIPLHIYASSSSGRPTVLVVEDEPDLRDLLRTVFEDEGFHVLCAANGEDGWDLWRRRSPTVVVSDVMMPALDGYGLLRRLQDALKTTCPPMVLMTAAPPRSDSLPVPLVAKPFDIGELVALVEDVVANTGAADVSGTNPRA